MTQTNAAKKRTKNDKKRGLPKNQHMPKMQTHMDQQKPPKTKTMPKMQNSHMERQRGTKMNKEEREALRVFFSHAPPDLKEGWAGQIVEEYLDRTA
jgi:hypothetical protein